MKSIVAIVGRPNVGKSTLFNRIVGERRAIVDDMPGVTRDRNYAVVERFEKPFILVDTGGFEPVTEDRMLQQMREQSLLAMEEADVILFLMDAKQGLTPADNEVASMLRRVDKPVFMWSTRWMVRRSRTRLRSSMPWVSITCTPSRLPIIAVFGTCWMKLWPCCLMSRCRAKMK